MASDNIGTRSKMATQFTPKPKAEKGESNEGMKELSILDTLSIHRNIGPDLKRYYKGK